MYLLGIDVGTSSIKVAVVDVQSQQTVASVQYPESENPIISLQPGWAEQSPDTWWEHVQAAILKANLSGKYDPMSIVAIGIAYQMHGLVCVDKDQNVVRNSIIWCDSRAVPFGDKAFQQIGRDKALSHLLNSPGNFTAAKLAWVKQNEPDLYEKIDKIMLPGDFIAMKLTGTISTSVSALSEGVFWDFKNETISSDVLNAMGISETLIPEIKEVFSPHGALSKSIAISLGLKEGIPVTYKAGDQPNNAFSLNVLQPGEVAATAGTSGVVYGVTDKVAYDPASRVNSFAHVNYTAAQKRIGILLCINGTGILNSWLKNNIFKGQTYDQINAAAAAVAPGSEGLLIYPFGNGAERVLGNQDRGAAIKGLQFNRHHTGHIARAAQEGIVFSLAFGMEIMVQMGLQLKTVRAGYANMFLSDVFAQAFATTTGAKVELYNTDGAIGAARAAGLGAGIYKNTSECFGGMKVLKTVDPEEKNSERYQEVYEQWKSQL